jgi:hypothetical protein
MNGGDEMVYLTETAKQASAKIWHTLSDDPLLRPLGRACDGTINKALAARKLGRADLFTPGNTLAPHRHRLAEMLAVYHFSTPQIVARHWSELKLADHRCAHCADKKRCDRWLRGRRAGDSPKRFCPNVTTFERWRRDYLQRECVGARSDGDVLLEAGLAQTREVLRQHRLQESQPSGR